MSLKTKRKIKNLGKIIAAAVFALLMFTNIKISTMDHAELSSDKISLAGLEFSLFDEAYATEAKCSDICTQKPITIVCTYLYTVGYCYGEWK